MAEGESRGVPCGYRRGAKFGAASSLVVEFALTAAYAVLTLAWLRAPAGGLARLSRPWREFLDRALGPVVSALGKPPCKSTSASAAILYREYVQLVLIDAGGAAICYLACAPLWGAWARTLRRHPRWASADPARVESELEMGQGVALAGALGATWFLVAAPYPATNCAWPDPWLFLRAPLVITLAYGLACFAIAFGFARGPEPKD